MITLNASGGSVTFTFSGNSTYLNDGTIEVPVNSLALIIDESDMATFRKAASNDIFVSANIAEFGMTKDELMAWYKANMVGSTGGGGGTDTGTVQTMIDQSISGKADSSAVTEEISAAVSGKVNVSDNIVSAHTFNARSADGGSYYTKLKFDGRHFLFNDFHSKKISVYPMGGLNGQLFTSLYLNSYNYVTYDAAAYLSGSTNDDYPSSFTSVTWIGDETKMKVEINSEGYLDLIAQGDYWFGQIDSNLTQELYVNILNDIASGQSASVINDSIVNNLENLGNTINGIQYELNGKLDTSAYTPINVDSTLSQASVNPIQNKSLFNELRVSGASSGDTTIVFVNGESTNYPEGVTVIKFEPTQSNTWASYEFYNGSSYLGSIQVSYYGNISVELSLDGATYTTSGNTVILTVPSTLGITKIAQLSGDYNNFTVKVENPPIYTPLKDVVSGKQNTLIAGRGISITTGETADTISVSLSISAGTGENSIAEGKDTIATGDRSHAEGERTTASGDRSHAEGYRTTASGQSSHAEGAYTLASGYHSHAEGDNTVASGGYSHAEGDYTLASAYQAHAEGYETKAIGQSSHAEGDHTIANNEAEHASGAYNVSNSASTTFGNAGNTLFSVGNGTADDARHNAFEIRQNGDIYCSDGTNDVKLQDTITATAANTSALGGLNLVKLTESDYQSLSVKDPDTLYVVIPDPTNP